MEKASSDDKLALPWGVERGGSVKGDFDYWTLKMCHKHEAVYVRCMKLFMCNAFTSYFGNGQKGKQL